MARVKILFFLTMVLWSCNDIKCGSIGVKSDFKEISDILQEDVAVEELSNSENDFEEIFPASENSDRKNLNTENEASSVLKSNRCPGPRYRDNCKTEKAVVGSSGETNSNQYTRDNKVKYDESCYYPYRSSTPLYCSYYVYFGNTSDANDLIFEKKFKKPRRKQTPIEFSIRFNGNENADTIGYIFLEYSSSENKTIHDDDFFMLRGGIGRRNFNLKIRSDHDYPNEYRVAVYNKKPSN